MDNIFIKYKKETFYYKYALSYEIVTMKILDIKNYAIITSYNRDLRILNEYKRSEVIKSEGTYFSRRRFVLLGIKYLISRLNS